MKNSMLIVAFGATLATSVDAETVNGPMAFDPIPGSAYGAATDAVDPFIIPEGFHQSIVSDEWDLDLYAGNDWPDMNTVNETRKQAGRYLYRTHEVRPGNDLRNDGTVGGSVSVVDLKTGAAKELATRSHWEAVDGLVWTPWHTLLVAEETITAAYPDPEVPQAQSGLLYEITIDKKDPMTAESVDVRPLLGSLSHEGIEVDAEGNVYVIDEERSGSIYKFVPENYGDLSSGQLYALRVENGRQTGAAEWVALDMNQVQISARVAAGWVGATEYCRPEDLERIGNTLYAALTCEPRVNGVDGAGAVLGIKLGEKPRVTYFVESGVNAEAEDPGNNISGLKRPDNLADGPDGKLWIVEDNVPSDIWVAEPDTDGDGYADGLHLFASLKDVGAEGTGIYFGKDPRTLLVNIQHSETGNDKTVAITNRNK